MIALPILGVTAADLAFRSGELSQAEQLTRQMGAADAEFTLANGSGPVLQSPDGEMEYHLDGDGWESAEERPADEVAADLAALLPPGTDVHPNELAEGVVHSRTGLMTAAIREFDATSPVADGLFTLLRGHYPQEPGEVAATQAFLDESGLHVGSELRVKDGERSYRITGAYERPDALRTAEVLARPGAVLPLPESADAGGYLGRTTYLADVPGGGVTWDMVVAANEHGFTADSKAVLAAPPPDSEVPLYAEEGWSGYTDPGADAEAVAIVITVVSLIILEICLLAGPAFAVGARRSRRQLGLIGANGGDRRHLRAVMLASGVVLGAFAAVIGVTVGILLTLAARPLIENQLGSRFGAWDFRITELAGIAFLAVLVGLLAALVPAVGAARSSVLESLTGRRGVRRAGRVLPVVGAVALVLGAVLAIVGGLTLDSTVVVAVGSVIAELGLVALTPFIVGVFGRLGRWLPLSPRLALRDAARNRGRTAPAVAAVLAAVAGTVAVSTVMTSDDAEARAEYTAYLPEGTVSISSAGTDDTSGLTRAGEIAEAELPVDIRADIGQPSPGEPGCEPYSGDDCGWAEVVVPEGQECPLWEPDAAGIPAAERRALVDDPRCDADQGGTMLAVAGPELLDVLGTGGAADRAALERGEAITFSDRWIADGSVSLRVYEREPEYGGDGEPLTPPDHEPAFPARLVETGNIPFAAVITPETAEAAGLRVVPSEIYFSTTRMPSSGEQQEFEGVLADTLGVAPYVEVEDGFESETAFGLLILGLAAMVITLGAAGIATGLAQADSEADLATLAAVGATPRLRRTLSGLQCGLIAAMGVLLGAVSGLVPALGLLLSGHRSDVAGWERSVTEGWGGGPRPELFISLPWSTFVQLIVVVPLVACLLAALLTRSRIHLARRAG
nr:ABC transporter permease [Streptomyces sp. MP131-18]